MLSLNQGRKNFLAWAVFLHVQNAADWKYKDLNHNAEWLEKDYTCPNCIGLHNKPIKLDMRVKGVSKEWCRSFKKYKNNWYFSVRQQVGPRREKMRLEIAE